MVLDDGLTEKLNELAAAVNRGSRIVSISGLSSSAAKALLVHDLGRRLDRSIIVVTDTNTDADTWYCDLEFYRSQSNSNEPVISLPAFETDPYSGVSPHAETQERRALALWRMTGDRPGFIILPAKSLITRTVAPDEIAQLGARLVRDEDFSPDELIEKLVRSGYVREDPIHGVGQFSLRGGIVDLWSADSENPVRIEFFGDTVDSIREFDPETQLSTRQLTETYVAPMREFAATAADLRAWARVAGKRFPEERFARNLTDRTDFADEGETFSGWEFALAISKPLSGTAFDYFPSDALFIVDEPVTIESTLGQIYEHLGSRFHETI
jgi:transcription-repair coupling factor (superfamily II helicase)